MKKEFYIISNYCNTIASKYPLTKKGTEKRIIKFTKESKELGLPEITWSIIHKSQLI